MIDSKVKEFAMRRIQEGKTLQEVADFCNVSRRNVSRWRKLYREKGEAAFVRMRRTRKRQIDLHQLYEYAKAHPHAYLREIAAQFNVSISRVNVLLKQMGLGRKIKSKQRMDNAAKKVKLEALAE